MIVIKLFITFDMCHLLIGPMHAPIFEQQFALQNVIGQLILSKTHLNPKCGNFVNGQLADHFGVFPQLALLMDSQLTLKRRVMLSQHPFFLVQHLKFPSTSLMILLLYPLVNFPPSLLKRSLMLLMGLQTLRHLANPASHGVSSSGPSGFLQ
jgi:hypothetical protein